MTDNAHLTSDMDTEQSDASRDTDKLLRNRNSSRFSARFGKYFGKLSKNTKNRETGKPSEEGKDSLLRKGSIKDTALRKSDTKDTSLQRKGDTKDSSLRQSNAKDASLKKGDTRKSYTKKRSDGNLNGKLQSKPQDKPPQIAKESKRGRNLNDVRSKSRLTAPEHDSDSEEKEQYSKRGTMDRRSSSKVIEANNKLRKNPSVTFSPTVTCTTDNAPVHTAHKTKNTTSKRILTPTHPRARHVITSETSDTDSTAQELQMV